MTEFKENYPDSEPAHAKFTHLHKIKNGFKINSMKMKDGQNGKVMWENTKWDITQEKQSESLPKELLECASIVREINFSSVEKIEELELIQNFYLQDELIESSRFAFGFVIPNSTNNWEQQIDAKEEMFPYQILSGNLQVETIFLSEGHVIRKNEILIYYI